MLNTSLNNPIHSILLQILEGSQKCGRIEHGFVSAQQGADLERVKELQKKLEHLYVEMEPGKIIPIRVKLEMHYSKY